MAMILIDKQEVTENGVVYIVETYQSDKTGKESLVKRIKPSEEPVPVDPEPTQLDRIEEQVNNIANGTTAENTEAINAFLGV